MIDFYTTFDSDPGAEFATLSGWRTSTPVAVYNTAAEAIDLTATDGAAWILTSKPVVAPDEILSFEADLEFITDTANRKHAGIWLVQDSPLVVGYRIAHLDSSWIFSKWASWESETALSVTSVSNPTFNAGERKRLRVVLGSQYFRFYVDDLLVFSREDQSYLNLRPGISFYQGTVRVHSVRYEISEASIAVCPSVNFAFCNSETKEQSWPGETQCLGIESIKTKMIAPIPYASMLIAPPSRSDFGFIEGTVTRKGTSAPDKKVICLDERFNLVAATKSDSNGYYRFDSLPIHGLYAIHAYDNEVYQYAPVGADRRTPEAYS